MISYAYKSSRSNNEIILHSPFLCWNRISWTKATQLNFLRTSNCSIHLLRVWCSTMRERAYMTTGIFSDQVKIHFCNCEIRRVLINFKLGFPLILLTNCTFTYWAMQAYDFSLISAISKVVNWRFSIRQQNNSTLIIFWVSKMHSTSKIYVKHMHIWIVQSLYFQMYPVV